jgi:hypothetical protein
MLPRLHLFEFMDLESFPASMRRRMTDCLRDVEAFTGLFNWAVPLIVRLLRGSGRRAIVDLGTGSGGPIVRLYPALVQAGALDELALTDLYPHPEAIASQPGLRYDARSVDASSVPQDLHGMRVLCNSFHHMPPDLAQAVLADAHAAGEPLLVLEALNRDPFAMVASVAVAVMAWVLMPLLRRFDVLTAVLWWLVPIVPVLLVWEGVVSCLRCYTRRELGRMVATLPGATHETGVVQTGFIGARIRWFYLHGRPTEPSASAA